MKQEFKILALFTTLFLTISAPAQDEVPSVNRTADSVASLKELRLLAVDLSDAGENGNPLGLTEEALERFFLQIATDSKIEFTKTDSVEEPFFVVRVSTLQVGASIILDLSLVLQEWCVFERNENRFRTLARTWNAGHTRIETVTDSESVDLLFQRGFTALLRNLNSAIEEGDALAGK